MILIGITALRAGFFAMVRPVLFHIILIDPIQILDVQIGAILLVNIHCLLFSSIIVQIDALRFWHILAIIINTTLRDHVRLVYRFGILLVGYFQAFQEGCLSPVRLFRRVMQTNVLLRIL